MTEHSSLSSDPSAQNRPELFKMSASSLHGYKAITLDSESSQVALTLETPRPHRAQPTLALELEEEEIERDNNGQARHHSSTTKGAKAAAAGKNFPPQEAIDTLVLPELQDMLDESSDSLHETGARDVSHRLIQITNEQKKARPVLKQLTERDSVIPLQFEQDENRWDSTKIPLPELGQSFDNYRIKSLVGKGGFGAVFSVKNLNLGRTEALKLILPSAKIEISDIEQRFSREIDIASRLEHPNIVRLYRSGSLEQRVMWMSMELIHGHNLSDIIADSHGLNFNRAKDISLQILDALSLAHQSHIVHRDLKPSNIIISRLGQRQDHVTILDFGLAKALGPNEDHEVQELTMQNKFRVYGTPQYMAPEQVLRGIIGPWTDVYAIGLILYELLTGRAAVSGDSPAKMAMNQAYGQLNLPKRLANTAIGEIIAKACSKKGEDRYPDAAAFYKALEKLSASNAFSKKHNNPTLPMIKALSPRQSQSGISGRKSVLRNSYIVLTTLLSLGFITLCLAWALSYVEISF